MRSIAESLIDAAKKHERQTGRVTLQQISEKTGIAVRTLRRLFSGRMRNDRIPYVMVVAVLSAIHCSVAEFEVLRQNRSQLNLLTKHYKKWRGDREDRFATRLEKATKFCTELKGNVTVGECHDCWLHLHDQPWRTKYGTRGRCRQAYITRRERK